MSLIPVERIETRILTLRGKKVLMDRDLAELYGVETRVLNQAVKRNESRFPDDFRIQLTRSELREVITICDNLADLRFSPKLPYAFTEHGAIMAASVLNSGRAVAVSIYVVRAFVKLREIVATTLELEAKMTELEWRVTGHDDQIKALVSAIRQLMQPPAVEKKRNMGF
ncbi:MAG: ORF6N domain-containing protein [Calditrichota bacterium]